MAEAKLGNHQYGDVVKFNGENYLQWSYSVQKCFRIRKKLNFLTEYPPNKNTRNYKDWMIENLMVMKWLWDSMEPYVIFRDLNIHTAKQIWELLKEKYSPEKNTFKIYDLYGAMFNNKQGERCLNEYYNSMKFLWEELIKCQHCGYDFEEQKRQQEQFFVAVFLNGLNSEYSSYKDEIFASSRLPTPAEAYTRLLRKGNQQKVSSHKKLPTTESSGFVSNSSNGGGRGGFRGTSASGCGGSGRSNIKSTHSDKSSDTVDDDYWGDWDEPANHNHAIRESPQNTKPHKSSGFGSNRRKDGSCGGFRGAAGGGGPAGGGEHSNQKCAYCGTSCHILDDDFGRDWHESANHNQVIRESSQNIKAPASSLLSRSGVTGVTVADFRYDILHEILAKVNLLVASSAPAATTPTWVNSEYEDEDEYWY